MGICWTMQRMKLGWGTVVVAGLAGAFLAGRMSGSGSPLSAPIATSAAIGKIDASATAVGENFSLATGLVSDEAEGVFVLDHASGLLQCSVLYPRAGQFGATFQCNVKESLGGAGKNAKYLMVTGTAQFPGGSNRPNANCVVYVLDQSTGAYVCYGIPFTKALVNQASPQAGVMLPLAVGKAGQGVDRDAVR